MSVIAIVGAGPGLGAAVARRFASAGFAVALIARNARKLEALVRQLAADGVTAKGYAADIRDREALARQVLPGMIERGAGTVVLINGSSAAVPNGNVAGTSTAFAGESAYGQMLHDAVSEKGVSVRQPIIPGAIGGGDPLCEPSTLTERIWDLHTAPVGPFCVTVGGEPA